MKDEEKTKAQLIEELKVLRGHFSKLESSHKATIDSLQRYRDFIENMDDSCFEVDLAGKLIFGNNALHRVTGYASEEYSQLKLEEQYATPEEAQRIIKIYNDLYRKGKRGEKFYVSLRTKEGKIVTMEVSALLVRDAEGQPVGFRGIGRDVTERIRVEEDLRKYKEFVENIEDSCYERDFDGHYLLYNDALLRKSGFTIEELTQESWEARIVSQEERQRARQVYAEVYRTGIPAKLTINKLLRKDGGIQSVELLISLSRDATGTPKGYRIISRLITERVRMEQEQERYRNFIESINEICFENDLKGTVTFMNEAMCRVLDLGRE
jgi:PAS domain S-box-containing protein